jgi:hypothetical protein
MRRKFKQGEQITSVAQILEHDWFIVHFGPVTAKTVNREVLKSWQLRTCEMFVDRGSVYIAERMTNGEYYEGKTDEELIEMLGMKLCNEYCAYIRHRLGSCEVIGCDKALQEWKKELVK